MALLDKCLRESGVCFQDEMGTEWRISKLLTGYYIFTRKSHHIDITPENRCSDIHTNVNTVDLCVRRFPMSGILNRAKQDISSRG